MSCDPAARWVGRWTEKGTGKEEEEETEARAQKEADTSVCVRACCVRSLAGDVGLERIAMLRVRNVVGECISDSE